MKKFISFIIILILTVTSLSSCGKKVTCDFCNTEFYEATGEKREFDDVVIYCCKDCYEYMTKGWE